MANKKPSALTPAGELDGTELFHGVQGGNSRKVTGNQIKTAILNVFGSNGIIARTAAETFVGRAIAGPAAGITVSNGDGVAGNPTLALANDLAAVEGLASAGLAARTAADTWAVRTITAPAAGIAVSNGDGVSGDPTIALANDLAAYEGLSTIGLVARTGDGAAATRAIAAGTGITVTNGDGVSGNPTIATSFRGALVKRSTNQTAANYSVIAAIPFDSEEYDTDGFHDNVTNNTRFTIPAGVSKVRLAAGVEINALTADVWTIIVIRKNGSSNYAGVGAQDSQVNTTTRNLGTNTPVISVNAGDYFECYLLVQTDNSITVTTLSWFAIEVVS